MVVEEEEGATKGLIRVMVVRTMEVDRADPRATGVEQAEDTKAVVVTVADKEAADTVEAIAAATEVVAAAVAMERDSKW